MSGREITVQDIYRARAAGRLGVCAAVRLSESVPGDRIDNVRRNGGEVRTVVRSFDEAAREAERLIAEDGMTLVHAFNDPGVIAGQGTIGLELLEDLPELDTALAPLSGGGLIGGIALAAVVISGGNVDMDRSLEAVVGGE